LRQPVVALADLVRDLGCAAGVACVVRPLVIGWATDVMIVFARSMIVCARYRCALQIVDELLPFGAGSMLLLILA
jgi:hypothetical protein